MLKSHLDASSPIGRRTRGFLRHREETSDAAHAQSTSGDLPLSSRSRVGKVGREDPLHGFSKPLPTNDLRPTSLL